MVRNQSHNRVKFGQIIAVLIKKYACNAGKNNYENAHTYTKEGRYKPHLLKIVVPLTKEPKLTLGLQILPSRTQD